MTPAAAGGRADENEEMDVDEPPRPTMDRDGQRAVIKSFCDAGKTAMEAYDHLCKANGSGALSRSQTYRVYKQFKDGMTEYKNQRGKFEGPRGVPRQRTEETRVS